MIICYLENTMSIDSADYKYDVEHLPEKQDSNINGKIPRNPMIKSYIGGKVRKNYSDDKMNLGCMCTCKCPEYPTDLKSDQTSLSWAYGSIFFYYMCF